MLNVNALKLEGHVWRKEICKSVCINVVFHVIHLPHKQARFTALIPVAKFSV